jgi:putative transposase
VYTEIVTPTSGKGNKQVRISYQYRMKPTKEQAKKIDETLEKLRYQYNYLLAQRFNWYEQNRSPINRCSLVVCHLPELKEQPNYLKKTVLGTKKSILKCYRKFLKKLN